MPSSTVFRYYDGLLYMMSLLHASGRFQAIRPANAVAESAAAAQRAAQEERIGASFLLALGRTPTTSELAAWTSREPAPIAALLERHRAAIKNDAGVERDVLTRAGRDALGALPSADDVAGLRGAGTYADVMRRHVTWLAEHPADYERVLHRAYRTHLGRDAYSVELDYWKKYPALPYVFLVGCVENWALRNQPGLMATAGVPSVSVTSGYLSVVRLSPGVAAEARMAAGLPRSGPADLAHHIVAPGADAVVSVGGIHFAAAGAPDWRPPQTPRSRGITRRRRASGASCGRTNSTAPSDRTGSSTSAAAATAGATTRASSTRTAKRTPASRTACSSSKPARKPTNRRRTRRRA